MEYSESLYSYRFSYLHFHPDSNKNELIAFTFEYLRDINTINDVTFENFLSLLDAIDEHDDEFWKLLFKRTIPNLYNVFIRWRPVSYKNILIEVFKKDFTDNILSDIVVQRIGKILYYKNIYPNIYHYFSVTVHQKGNPFLRSSSPEFRPQNKI